MTSAVLEDANVWTQITGSYTAPSVGTKVIMYLEGPAGGVDLRVDTVSLVLNVPPPPELVYEADDGPDNGNSAFGTFPLQECQGDCDNNEDCSFGLICFQRGGTEAVPGCSGLGLSGKDYCVKISIESLRKRDATITVLDASGNPVDGAVVNVQQIRREFGFGTAIANRSPSNVLKNNVQYQNFIKENFEWAVP